MAVKSPLRNSKRNETIRKTDWSLLREIISHSKEIIEDEFYIILSSCWPSANCPPFCFVFERRTHRQPLIINLYLPLPPPLVGTFAIGTTTNCGPVYLSLSIRKEKKNDYHIRVSKTNSISTATCGWLEDSLHLPSINFVMFGRSICQSITDKGQKWLRGMKKHVILYRQMAGFPSPFLVHQLLFP